MSNYIPDNDATAGDPWDTAFLSDRDVSGQVPINFVPHPGVFVTPACFPTGVYDDQPFKECFSNLLASEIRKFVVDLYWDTLNKQFSLCPAEISTPATNTSDDGSDGPVVTRDLPYMRKFAPSAGDQYTKRQGSSSNQSPASSVSEILSSVSSTASTTVSAQNSSTSSVTSSQTITRTTVSPPPAASTTSASGNTLYQIGPYQCSVTTNLATVIEVLKDYITRTTNSLEARLQFLIFNLHVASIPADPTGSRGPLSGSQLPSPSDALGSYLIEKIGDLLYTPTTLREDRSNLNDSWYARRGTEYTPSQYYFTVDKLSNGDLSTPDGWPNENYAQLQQGKRLLVGYGQVDSQIAGYDVQRDNRTIFGPGALISNHATTLDDQGNITSGCFYNSHDDLVSQLNNSWASTGILNIPESLIGYAADNITTCGMSPMLNMTLNNSAATTDYEPYQSFGNQALFSWASGEPKNLTYTSSGSSTTNACALMVSTDEYQGHWRVQDCRQKYRVACRVAEQPYIWRLSTIAVSFLDAPDVCGSNASFAVPRTGLENLYLYNYLLSVGAAPRNEYILDGVWINFNSIDVANCWVTTGPNGTCPYYEDQDTIHQRQVLIPAIGAFIILVLTALTILVKCNFNRRNTKIRKRGEGGWDYEGVPS